VSLLKCAVPWPACPNCVVGEVDAKAGKVGAICRTCRRVWAGFPAGAPCGQNATHVVTDGQKDAVLMCDAHAALAAKFIPSAKVEPMRIERREILL